LNITQDGSLKRFSHCLAYSFIPHLHRRWSVDSLG
jgi:hypothetical protein